MATATTMPSMRIERQAFGFVLPVVERFHAVPACSRPDTTGIWSQLGKQSNPTMGGDAQS